MVGAVCGLEAEGDIMSDRITRRDLEGICRTLNKLVNGLGPDQPVWIRQDGQNVATVGMFYIDGAYGGWALYRVLSTSGGISDVLGGHRPARELYGLMRAWLDGWTAASIPEEVVVR